MGLSTCTVKRASDFAPRILFSYIRRSIVLSFLSATYHSRQTAVPCQAAVTGPGANAYMKELIAPTIYRIQLYSSSTTAESKSATNWQHNL